MARPKQPLIETAAATAKALELIDRHGVAEFNLRRLAVALGVSPSSLYHHFQSKDEILSQVCRLVIEDAGVAPTVVPGRTWQSYIRDSAIRYHSALMRHPNVAPLFTPSVLKDRFQDPLGTRTMKMLLTQGVPRRYTYPLVDSVNTLIYGSVVLNAHTMESSAHLPRTAPNKRGQSGASVRRKLLPTERMFRTQLDVLIRGWTAMLDDL